MALTDICDCTRLDRRSIFTPKEFVGAQIIVFLEDAIFQCTPESSEMPLFSVCGEHAMTN